MGMRLLPGPFFLGALVHGRRLQALSRCAADDSGEHFRARKTGSRGRRGGSMHGRRLRVGRRGEREPPAAHTLTPTLLPTTCVVVNKLVGLTLSDNRGCAPPVRKCLPPTVKSPQEAPPPHAASQVRGAAASTREGTELLIIGRWLSHDVSFTMPLRRFGCCGFDRKGRCTQIRKSWLPCFVRPREVARGR